jgi:predicted enzyme related to lactoylglutathione lyase
VPSSEAGSATRPAGVFLFLRNDDLGWDYGKIKGRGVNFVREPKTEDYGTVAVFEDLYGNLWDLIEFSER